MKTYTNGLAGFWMSWSVFVTGLLVMTFGIALMIKADAGSAPWDVFHIGLYNQLGLSIGTWSIIVGFFIITTTAFMEKSWPKAGAFLNMLLVGIFIDFYLWLPILNTPDMYFGQLIMLSIGIIVMGYGIGLYIAADKGAGPRDSLMLVLTTRTGWKVQHIRLSMEIIVLALGWLMKGPVSIGTLLFCVTIGPIVGFSLPQCKYLVARLMERGIKNEDFNKRKVRLDHYDGVGKKAR
ncbi:YczE/YyaS/YitT family protein [Guptibacillus algicola]|uniref:YczE/YyaS/YitT family protein n=1 Tax=Guptibacillus algicola TaxID=225844 RepID=UPI001CD52135|nr:YitT family protein [Alkalihalobacillus algicola]MCA0986169.1 YitT family protein [Alkalihalobacillus algicola]